MHLLSILLLAASTVSAIPSRGRSQKMRNRANGASGTSTVSSTPTSTPLFGDTAPTATYLPSVHWDTDTSGNKNLAPQDYHKFYYSENGVNGA
jgi:hypothetical protein